MNTAVLSSTVSNCLLQAGWSCGRKVNRELLFEDISKICGSATPAGVNHLIRELDGLTLSNSPWDAVNFCASVALLAYNRDYRYLRDLFGETVYPLGHIPNFWVYIGDSGRIYAIDEDWLLYYMFDSIEQMLERILARKPPMPIPISLRNDQRPPGFRD